jgi:hypothetical protein
VTTAVARAGGREAPASSTVRRSERASVRRWRRLPSRGGTHRERRVIGRVGSAREQAVQQLVMGGDAKAEMRR